MKILIVLLGFVIIQSCGQSEREKERIEYEKQKVINESKLYYPKAYDDWWRMYKPKLRGAEGWITEDCEDSRFKGKKGIVTYQLLTHKSWGTYKGSLTLELLDTKESIDIDYKCFKPDFEVGEWLSKEY
ncbi:hypothetical protein [Zobellia galactanivorans]|uniref:hypothetical protein n=1 Tax=Zobellia galactanivorans (strain DSM 12802 / CCUG 47099 / CIP 106680 / NCIMB 13871 / Dsij) TaxID=63186 RepID=UPI0011DD1692|nr:hypothetical protein [Zobellia galactanivorans]